MLYRTPIPRPSHRAFSLPSFSLIIPVLLFLLAPPASSQPIQVHIIHRHGARAHLSKSPTSPNDEASSPPLLPAGYDEAKALGAFARARYPNLVTTDLSKYLSLSSNLDRTLVSASAFWSGFLAGENHDFVPTKVFAVEESDTIIRGYANCEYLDGEVSAFLSGSEADSYASSTQARRELFAGRIKEEPSLANWFNVYDKYILFYSYDVTPSGAASGLTKPTAAEMAEITAIADWVETRKYSKDIVGNRAGGALLREISRGFQPAFNKSSTIKMYSVIEYSAHFPTLLGLLAAMGLERQDGFVTGKIPPFASAVVVEISERIVNAPWPNFRLAFYNPLGSGGNGSFEFFSSGISACNSLPVPCRIQDWEATYGPRYIEDSTEYYRECGGGPGGQCTAMNPWLAAFIGAMAGLAILAICALGYRAYQSRKRTGAVMGKRSRSDAYPTGGLGGIGDIGPPPTDDEIEPDGGAYDPARGY